MNAWHDDEEDESVQGELDDQGDDDIELEDRYGSVEVRDEGDELVLIRTGRYGDAAAVEMLRFDRVKRLLRIFPKIRSHGQFEDQFDRITELQVEAPDWDPRYHSAESERFALLHAVGLPKGFSAVYEFGLGIKRDYRDIIDKIERSSSCTVIRFGISSHEGPDAIGGIFTISLQRFADYRAAVDRNRDRGRTAVRRVIDAESHNAVADLFHIEPVTPKYGRNEVIRAITEEVSTGHVMNAADRALLVDEVTRAAPRVAQEAPERFGQLREGIELASLEVLVGDFEKELTGHHTNDEPYWQDFFNSNRFALQQLFAMPIVVEREQAHVQAPDVDGRGARITDFLCANTVTRTAVLVEIKTPGAKLTEAKPYRGKGSAAVYPPHRELSGSVSQLQSQMAAVRQDLSHRLPLTQNLNIDPWNEPRGAVIAGRFSSLTAEQSESFLRYRAGLATVTVLGYDEVLERLKSLLAMLRTAP